MKLVKLGGSVVTDKNKPQTPNIQRIKALAREVAESGQDRLVIIHGGGSYGHPLAKKHSIATGLVDATQVPGFSETHQAMVQLNKLIVDTLLEAGVPAFSVSPSSFIRTHATRLETIDTTMIEGLLDIGLVPVLYGDTVLDTEQGFAILSGDQLIVKLALELRATQIVLGSDVDGIFTDNPKTNPEARLIERLSVGRLREAEIGSSSATDVTGGMYGKVAEAVPAVEAGVEVLLVNATVDGRVKKSLRGEKVKGTVLER